MSEILRTAAWLTELDRADLRAILEARRVRAADIGDFFDLAEALLQPASIQTALQVVRREDLDRMRGGEPLASYPCRMPLALVGDDGLPWPSVSQTMESVVQAGDAASDGTGTNGADGDEALMGQSTHTESGRAGSLGERILHTTTVISDFLVVASRSPVRVTARGRVAVADARRVSEAIRVDEANVSTAVPLARLAGLWAASDGVVASTREGASWMEAVTLDRWETLARAWLRALSDEARAVLTEMQPGENLAVAAARIFPAHRSLGDELDRMRPAGLALGLFSPAAGVTELGAAVLADDFTAARALCSAALPAEVQQLYVQNDLSVIAPGPLRAADDVFLTRIADLEARGTASTWRISPDSLARALGEGTSHEEIAAFLTRLSPTGTPQALRFMLDDLAARRASLLVAPDGNGSTVSGTPEAVAPLAIDRQLRSLHLDEGDGVLHSPLSASVVAWHLAEAGYPSTLVDASGRPSPRTPARFVDATPTSAGDDDDISSALDRLAAAAQRTGGGDQNAEWIGRELELAAREHAIVLVDIETPTGPLTDRELEPIRVSNGRLRAKDPRAGVERTVPLASISRVRPMPANSDPA